MDSTRGIVLRKDCKCDPFPINNSTSPPQADDESICRCPCHVADSNTRTVSLEEVQQEASEKSTRVLACYQRLRQIVERHEATLRERWTTKTANERVHLLLKAWPGMAASRRPDLLARMRESPEERLRDTKYKDWYMLPQINQQVLSLAKPMLLLLNARARHHPSEFAAADNKLMHLGLKGRRELAIMGKLIAWKSRMDARYWALTGKQFFPGEGLLVLGAQARLLEFLVECCENILHDIPKDDLVGDSFAIQPEPQEPLLRTGVDTSVLEPWAGMATAASYRPPEKPELGRIASLLGAKKSALEDRIWMLREDPAYFAHNLQNMRNYCRGKGLNTGGKLRGISDDEQGEYGMEDFVKEFTEVFLMGKIVGDSIIDIYFSLEYFTELHHQAEHLQILHDKYGARVLPLEDLPEDYVVALLRFRRFLRGTVRAMLLMLDQSAFILTLPQVKRGRIRMRPREILHELLKWKESACTFLIPLPLLVEELEYLSRQGDAGIASFDFVIALISNLSVAADCLKQLELYRPWAQNFGTATAKRREEIESAFSKPVRPWTNFFVAVQDNPDFFLAASVPHAFVGTISYPINKPRTKETVDALRHAESSLDHFWAKFDGMMKEVDSSFPCPALRRLLAQQGLLRRTAEWGEPIASSKTNPHSDEDISSLSKSLASLHFGASETKTQEGPNPGVEAHTEGVGPKSARNTSATAPDNLESVTNLEVSFTVDAHALKAFRVLFYDPYMTSTPGSLSWNEFLYAMVSMGFKAQKLYSTLWQFSPTKPEFKNSILFFEARSKDAIEFEVARRYGRRLSRAYGWHSRMFTLKKKE